MRHVSRTLRRATSVLALVAVPTSPVHAQAESDIHIVHVRMADAGLVADSAVRLTDRAGYDNQPYFTPDGRYVLYTSIDETGQADIRRIDLATRRSSAVTRTSPESEYSATPMPGGARFSAIRVEADSTQRLWSFAMDGSDPRVVLEAVRPVGYHAWLDDNRVALFVLGSPATLQIADVAAGTARVLAEDIGRSLHRVPDRDAISFVHREGAGGTGTIKMIDPSNGATEPLVQPFEENEYHAWLPPNTIVTARDSRLHTFTPGTDTAWMPGPDLAAYGIRGISRIAVSPDGRTIALVAAPGLAGAVEAQRTDGSKLTAAVTDAAAVRSALSFLESDFPRHVDEWIRINEIPAKSELEQERAAYVRAQLEAVGLDVTIDSIGNVVARRPGTGGGETVVFAAHLDTVHPQDTDVSVTRDGNVLRSPGIFDNSASVANMLAVARALDAADIRTRGDIIFIGTAQEELGLIGMSYWLDSNPGVADVLVALDGGLPAVNYGALGIYWSRYHFTGEGSHTNTSAGKPHPVRALAEAVHSIYEIRIPEGRGGAVYNLGMLDGGKVFNAIPQDVSFTVDLRSVNPALLDSLDGEITRRVAAAAAAHDVGWSRDSVQRLPAGGTPGMLEDRLAHPLVRTALDAHEFVGIESRAVPSGSTDSNAGVVRGIPSISIGRTTGGDQHTLSEWADIEPALPATKIALLIAVAMAGLAGPST
jgi:acetylornithine deacetylase/succinyl-diaminopimelate desuccinylase-like protein